MPYKTRIAELETLHRNLDIEITKMEKNHPGVHEAKVHDMKKQRLQYRDELSRLRKLQWEWDHERVEMEDDR